METASPDQAAATGGSAAAGRPMPDGYAAAAFPWYGLDRTFTGSRWLMQVGTNADGAVEHGSLGHGEGPSLKSASPLADPAPESGRFAVVVTVAHRPSRSSSDGTGVLEATSVSSAAWLAGVGLLSATWPGGIERGLRQAWLDQQTAVAWELADDLGGPDWSELTLPVDGVPTPFRYRESEFGWVLAGDGPGVHIGAYGRGLSAYGLGLAALPDLAAYQD